MGVKCMVCSVKVCSSVECVYLLCSLKVLLWGVVLVWFC